MTRKKIETLRVRIAALQTERAALQAQVRSRSEVRAAVQGQVSQWRARAEQEARQTIHRVAYGLNNLPQLRAHVYEGSMSYPAEADLGTALSALLGAEAISAFLLADLDSIPEGLNRPERLARLEAIAVELNDLEAQEERLIEEADAAGEIIPRRPNARPEIVLGVADVPKAKPYEPKGHDVQAPMRQTVATSPYVGSSRL